MPIFAKDNFNSLCVKPLLQLIFEQLYGLEFREFCFIVGRGKRVMEDHFTPDYNFIEQLNSRGRVSRLWILKLFMIWLKIPP
ncbi:MAG: hypothetical protein QXZ54_06105 [Candidatus Methanomethylicia archaeon]